MSLIDANSYDFSSGHYCYSRKNRGQSYTASSVWCQNSCNNFWLSNNWLAIGVPLGFSFMAGLLQAVPSWLSSNNTNNNINSVKRYSSEEPQAEVKSKEEIELEKDDKTDRETVTKILNDAKIQVDNEILEAIVLKYPTMKAIPSVNLTIEQRVINYAKGLKASKNLEALSLGSNSETIKLEEVQKALDARSTEDFNNAYLQYGREKIEVYDTNDDGKIELSEYIEEEKRNSGELFDEKATTAIFNTLDINNNGLIEQDEMAALTWATSKFNDTETSKSAFDITAKEMENLNTALATIGLKANLEEIKKTATDEEMELLLQSIREGTPAKVLLEQLLSSGYKGFHSYLQQQ